MVKISSLTSREKHTFCCHLIFSAIDGIFYGVMALNEFILLKSLRGTDYQVGILFEIPAVVLLFGIIINEIIRRTHNKKRFLRISAIITRLPLLLLIFFPSTPEEITPLHQYLFLLILFVYYLSSPIFLPVINLFLKNSYSHENFGKLYSYATSISKIFAVVATFITGWLLDVDYYYFRYIFFGLGIAGIIAVYILSEIDYKDEKIDVKVPFFKSISEAVKRMMNILRTNKPFLHFEIAFFLYGIAYLSTSGVISLLLNDVLHLNYSSLAFYKNAYNLLNILLLPVFGHSIGKVDPRRFGIKTFFSMAMFLFFLFLTYFFDYYVQLWNIKLYFTLVVAYIFYGIFAARMGLLWYIGSAYFTHDKAVADYQAIHLTFTGLRGAFAPILGIVFYRIIGYTGVFLIGIGFLILAMGVMYLSMKRFSLENIN